MSEIERENDTPDVLFIKGVDPSIDGRYACNVVTMLLEGHPNSITNREAHRLKIQTGIRAGELMEALSSGDNDVLIGLACTILTRRGKSYDEDLLWDSPMGSGITYEIAKRSDGDPPPTPPTSGGESRSTETPESDGGPSGEATADPSPSDPSLTGPQPSDTTST